MVKQVSVLVEELTALIEAVMDMLPEEVIANGAAKEAPVKVGPAISTLPELGRAINANLIDRDTLKTNEINAYAKARGYDIPETAWQYRFTWKSKFAPPACKPGSRRACYKKTAIDKWLEANYSHRRQQRIFDGEDLINRDDVLNYAKKRGYKMTYYQWKDRNHKNYSFKHIPPIVKRTGGYRGTTTFRRADIDRFLEANFARL